MKQLKSINAGFIMKRTNCVLFLIFIVSGCSGEDKNLENKLSVALKSEVHSNSNSLNLISVIGGEWEQVCLQSPYLPQKDFERLVGRKVHGFRISDDDVYKFWVFYRDGTQKWGAINRVKVMDRHPTKQGSPCIPYDRPFLKFSTDTGKKSYFLMRKDEIK